MNPMRERFYELPLYQPIHGPIQQIQTENVDIIPNDSKNDLKNPNEKITKLPNNTKELSQ